MIIIDQNGETKLASALEQVREQPPGGRCIHLHFKKSATETMTELHSDILDVTRGHLSTTGAQIFVCHDGDIFILSRNLPKKITGQLIDDIAALLGRPIHEDWVEFFEFPLHTLHLLVLVGNKTDKLRQQKEAEQKQTEEYLLAVKREQILSGGKYGREGDIKKRRGKRFRPELLIIEDDAFSRRLVENVLKQQFTLTGLGKADTALDTYARLAPDLVFLDINLPDVTGHELLEKIIELDPDAYVVMLSGNCDKDNINKAMSKGAKGFVAKPFSTDKSYQYINRCPTIRKETFNSSGTL